MKKLRVKIVSKINWIKDDAEFLYTILYSCYTISYHTTWQTLLLSATVATFTLRQYNKNEQHISICGKRRNAHGNTSHSLKLFNCKKNIAPLRRLYGFYAAEGWYFARISTTLYGCAFSALHQVTSRHLPSASSKSAYSKRIRLIYDFSLPLNLLGYRIVSERFAMHYYLSFLNSTIIIINIYLDLINGPNPTKTIYDYYLCTFRFFVFFSLCAHGARFWYDGMYVRMCIKYNPICDFIIIIGIIAY